MSGKVNGWCVGGVKVRSCVGSFRCAAGSNINSGVEWHSSSLIKRQFERRRGAPDDLWRVPSLTVLRNYILKRLICSVPPVNIKVVLITPIFLSSLKNCFIVTYWTLLNEWLLLVPLHQLSLYLILAHSPLLFYLFLS